MNSRGPQGAMEEARVRAPKPFARLVRHCIGRVMHGADGSDAGELDVGIGAMLALLAAPGAFAALFLADKYGSLFLFLRGQPPVNGYVASLSDEYFFIVVAMVVAGAVAIWKWDALIPGRRDYVNLAPLPIPAQHILYANLMALVLLAAILALDVNAASSVIFPLMVGNAAPSFEYVAVFFGTHLLAVVLASVFSFFFVLAILGSMMAVLPYRLFRRCSVYVRCAMIVFLMAMLSTSLAMAKIVQHPSPSSRALVQLAPPAWFAGLCQHMRSLPDPQFATLAKIAVASVVAVLVFALGAYGLSYRRCFTHSSESIANFATVGGAVRRGRLHRATDLFLRSPFERACFSFTLKTLFRSENHTLIVGGFTGIGIVLASETMFRSSTGRASGLPSVVLLSIPLIVIYFLLLGIRFSFEVPVMLRANWIFRLRTNPDANECVGLARKIMLTFLAPLLAAVLLLYGFRSGWRIGLIHAAIVAAVSILLIEILLVRLRKIPFTCSVPHFKSNVLVSVFFYVLGFVLFTSWVPTAEEWAFRNPLLYVPLTAAVAAIWLALERYRGELTFVDKRLIFEEQPDVAVEKLDLTFSR